MSVWTLCVCFLRAKSARVITFEQFTQALTELAPKRFKGKSKEEALQQLYGLIVGKEPANIGVTVSISPVSTIHLPWCPDGSSYNWVIMFKID